MRSMKYEYLISCLGVFAGPIPWCFRRPWIKKVRWLSSVMVPAHATAGSTVVALACPSLPLRPFLPRPTYNRFTARRVALTGTVTKLRS